MLPVDILLHTCNDSQEYYRKEKRNVGLGITYFSLGTFFVIFYIPCLIVMLRKELWSNPCYKLMFFVGVFDIGTMVANAFLPGVIMVTSLDYNCYPTLNQYIMDIWSICWNSSCCTVVALACNRYIYITSPVVWTRLFFGKRRVWIWISFSTAFGLILCAAYRSKYATMIVDTNLGLYVWPEGDLYGHVITSVTNIVTAILLIVPYVLTCCAIHKMASQAGSERLHTSAVEKRILAQVMVICSLTISVSVFYPILPFVTNNITIFQAVHIIWIISHGCNGIVYLTLNITVRKQVFAMFGFKKKTSVVSPNVHTPRKLD